MEPENGEGDKIKGTRGIRKRSRIRERRSMAKRKMRRRMQKKI